MKRFASFSLMIVTLIAMFSLTAVLPASAASETSNVSAASPASVVGCVILDVMGPGSGYVNITQGHTYNVYVNDVLVQVVTAPFSGPAVWSISTPGHFVITDTSCDTTSFKDGRLNNRDPWQTAAIYCENGGVTIYGLYNSIGFVAFKASKAEIARVPAKPSVNTRIKSAKGITLWRLTSGEFEVSGPNGYTFKWTGDCSK